jgi:hypothetical protein
MKSISASILVLAAAVLIVGSDHLPNDHARVFLFFGGCGVGMVGLSGWFSSFNEK